MPTISAKFSLISIVLLLALVVSGLVSISVSLLLGIAFALIIGNPFQVQTHWASSIILKTSIVLLGLSMDFFEVYNAASNNFLITVISILFAMLAGVALGRLLKVDRSLAFLIACGTAICGGSAIAAIAPAIRARAGHVIIAISVVFILNALGLLLFPTIGSFLELTQEQFGVWAALAIHDTSSVVGAATVFGDESLKLATTTKLARALWIVPLAFVASYSFHHEKKLTRLPAFIFLFLLASLLTTFVHLPQQLTTWTPWLAKTGMAISLFLIGAGFSRETLATIQWSALWQGVILWLLVSLFSLFLIFAL